jgi:hypothetical protein
LTVLHHDEVEFERWLPGRNVHLQTGMRDLFKELGLAA